MGGMRCLLALGETAPQHHVLANHRFKQKFPYLFIQSMKRVNQCWSGALAIPTARKNSSKEYLVMSTLVTQHVKRKRKERKATSLMRGEEGNG